jgi:uncharacterized protein YndB with AHSA1/START domain
MAAQPGAARGTTLARIIRAPRRIIYQAFIDPQALMSWLPPAGMRGRIDAFDAREGGAYRMTLSHLRPDHLTRGKTTTHSDVVNGRFVTLIPDQRIVQQVEFASTDPAFAGVMTITWTFATVESGTKVTILCENAPAGIREADHLAGISSSLENLAAFTEGSAPPHGLERR